MPSSILRNFYRCIIESILSNSITVWFGHSKAQDRRALQWVVKTAQTIIGTALPTMGDINNTRVLRRALKIIQDTTHPQHKLLLLPSGKRYRSLAARTARLKERFFPQAKQNPPSALTPYFCRLPYSMSL